MIADANGLRVGDALATGTSLRIPQVSRSSNTASTFKPYNAGQAIGDTTPGIVIPPPPAQSNDGGCK